MKKAIAIALAVFSTIVLTACSSGTAKNTDTVVQDSANSQVVESASNGKETLANEKQIVKVGVSGTYVPWCYQEDGENVGYEIAVWNEIGKRANLDVEFVVAKFSGLFGLLDSRQIDTIAHQISGTEERKEKYDFSVPYAVSTYGFTVKNESPYQTQADLAGQKIGVGIGGNGEKTLNDLNQQENLSFIINTYDGGSVGIADVDLGRLEAFWIGTIAGKITIEKAGYDMRVIESDFVHEINRYPFVRNEKNTVLIPKVDEALTSMKEDGTLHELAQQWLQVDMTFDD